MKIKMYKIYIYTLILGKVEVHRPENNGRKRVVSNNKDLKKLFFG